MRRGETTKNPKKRDHKERYGKTTKERKAEQNIISKRI